MPAEFLLLPCRKDNYAVLMRDPVAGVSALVDAPEAAAIEAALVKTGWKLDQILITHYHADHTDGIAALKQNHGCRVIAPAKEASRIPQVDVPVREGDVLNVGTLMGRVLETPGHTSGHIAYWFAPAEVVF